MAEFDAVAGSCRSGRRSAGGLAPVCGRRRRPLHGPWFDERVMLCVSVAVLCAAAASLFIAGCADMNMGNMTPGARNTAIGAGVGALAGAARRGGR